MHATSAGAPPGPSPPRASARLRHLPGRRRDRRDTPRAQALLRHRAVPDQPGPAAGPGGPRSQQPERDRRVRSLRRHTDRRSDGRSCCGPRAGSLLRRAVRAAHTDHARAQPLTSSTTPRQRRCTSCRPRGRCELWPNMLTDERKRTLMRGMLVQEVRVRRAARHGGRSASDGGSAVAGCSRPYPPTDRRLGARRGACLEVSPRAARVPRQEAPHGESGEPRTPPSAGFLCV